MPELPEVEAARKAIEENCLGKKIKKAIIASDAKVIDGVSPSDFEAALVGKTLISAHRKGKNLWLQLDSPPFPSFQFGMAGAIYIKGVAVTKYKRSAVNDTDEWPSKYSKLFVELDDGLELSFTDKRRFAKVRLLNNPVSVPPISELGPDALLQPMAVDEFYKSLCKKKMPIKALLLDQSFISGIGNWIADEVLYQARIHPQQSASSFTKESCATLLKCIKEVIQYAVQVDAACNRFPLDWLFHYRWGKKPGKVNGKKIDFITSGGRTTAYVPELQKLSGNQISKRRNSEDNNDDNGVEGEDAASNAASLEDGAAKKAKPKRELKPRGRGKKPPPEQKTKATDADEDNDEAACNANNEDDQVKEEDQKKKEQSASNDKQPNGKKRSDKTVTDHNNKKPKKTVK
ncbi:formamidopyrimidine-DNA glycosylase isoform X2 [Ricinus communis]|uniref:formamidopyrimidine-DNA glycosylase isoform X2 n=1 Tax=Ricinus communis TaxID=3988 RepID=UPI000772AB41|nr:formamidopyrimidine-DNA glycosylase isoform X2 [Ricinus communis]|eukprot:XP_015573770.1 formamidopyrimidine-DNA glycosylase isoform X2 [Ricinus communis]